MQLFIEINRKPDFEYQGKFLKHVLFIAGGGKNTALLTQSKVMDKNLLKINIYYNGSRFKGIYIKKDSLIKYIITDILNGLADEKGLLALPCGDT